MSQWSGPGRGTGPGGRSSDLSSSGSGGHNGKDAAMLSDLPRKVCVRVCVLVCVRVRGKKIQSSSLASNLEYVMLDRFTSTFCHLLLCILHYS
jgi:hypothetical protein